jgi:predicted Zn-dependent peptidase
LQLNFYAKTPVRPLRSLEDIWHLTAVRILIGVLQFRIVSRYSSNHAPVQIDHSDSFREGCAVTSVTINADPRDWRNALACVVQEIRAICDYGITEGEMKRYMAAMLKDVEKGVVEADSVPSEDHLNFIMTSDVFDHVVMNPEQSCEAFKEVVPHVTMEQIHVTAKWMLGFIGYYGRAAAPPTTAVVVCTPTQVYQEQDGQWTPFNITEAEILELMLTVPDKSKDDALNQVDVPESLLQGQLEKLLGNDIVDKMTAWRACSRKHDEETGITQLLLPNGAKVNYANTTNESQGTMRMLVPGGRSADAEDSLGSAMVGIRTISESGRVSNFSREQIELFAVSNTMSVHLDLNVEFSYVDATFSMTDNGLVAVLELLHLLFQEPRWELPAFVRAQQAYRAQSYAVQKSLEQSTLDRLMKLMFAEDGRVSEMQVADLNRLTLGKVRKAVAGQLRPQDLEINLVGNFMDAGLSKASSQIEGGLSTGKHHEEGDEAAEVAVEHEVPAAAIERRLRELDENLWKYLGSVPRSEEPQADLSRGPVICRGNQLSPEARQRAAHLEDTDERAVANIGGGAPNRWGMGDVHHTECMRAKGFSWDTANSRVKDHPLYPSMCLLALREVMNTRLFSTVRDSLGLSYDCNFELSMFDRLEAGWYTCTVSAHPSRISEAVQAAKQVVQGVRKRPISDHEVRTACRTLLRRHETDLQTNEYWINLLTHLQYDNPKDTSCVRDIETMLAALNWRDVHNAYLTLLTDADQLFVSVSTAGPGSSYISGGAAPAPVSTSVPQEELLSAE